MRIHLLTVPSLGLEVRRESLTIHEPVASNNTDGRTFGEDIQKRGLFFKYDQFGFVCLMNKGRTFPAPDSPINAVNLPGTT